jgi:glycosyltransferase involved in cell wall biosynthesis
MVRVLALSGGANVPSARFRVAQFVGRLEQHGVELVHRPSRVGSYPPPERWRRPAWVAATLADRLPAVIRSRAFDVTLLQRELVSTLLTLEPLTRRPRVLDVDDAIWLLPRGSFAERLAARCDAVICGNDFVAEYFRRFSRAVYVLPTAVDTERFQPAAERSRNRGGGVIIGWSGSSAGFPYLALVEEALATVLRRRPQTRLRVVADMAPCLPKLPPHRLEFVRWSPDREVAAIQEMDIGIMPLADTPWERGKCSYKMLLYAASGVPAVVSPVGMNVEVLRRGEVGLAASRLDEWVAALLELVDDPEQRRRMGAEGRRVVEADYCVACVGPVLATILRDIA